MVWLFTKMVWLFHNGVAISISVSRAPCRSQKDIGTDANEVEVEECAKKRIKMQNPVGRKSSGLLVCPWPMRPLLPLKMNH